MSKQKYAFQTRILEAAKDDKGKVLFKVCIIQQGLGNFRDKNYYSADAIKSGVDIYEGKKAYFDHPTPTQEREQPGRSVREIAGHYENVRVVEAAGRLELNADFKPVSGPTGEEVTGLMEHAVQYSKKYPDKQFIGLSINGDGEGVRMEWDEFVKEIKPSKAELEKLKQVEGQAINVILKFTDAVSADLVTEAGAGGGLREEQKKNKKERIHKMLNAMKKLFGALESKDTKAVEEAQKALLMEADMGEKTQQEADMGEAEAMAKTMCALKKEMKKEDAESEEAYEAKVIAAAMKQMKQAAADKQEADKADGEKKDDEKKDDEKKDGEQKEAGDEKKDEKKPEAKDDSKSADAKADGDKDSMSAMKKEMEALKSEMEAMKQALTKKESEAKDAKESAAVAKTELNIKKRADLIDGLLAKTGWPRSLTKLWKPVLESCKSEDDMKATLKTMTTAAQQAHEEEFAVAFSSTTVEKQAGERSTNDDLFS